MMHLKIDGLVAILERTCSYDDLFGSSLNHGAFVKIERIER